jgi:hypothetical protein
MDKNPISKTPKPTPETSPEEDIALLAIEALEARAIDPNPEPWSPSPRPKAAVLAEPVPIIQLEPATVVRLEPVKIVKPLVIKSIEPMPKVIVKTKPEVVVTPPIAIEKIKKPLTPAEAMAEALANAPAMSYFQFFLRQHAPRKVFIIIGIAVVVIGVAAVIYFTVR